MPARRARRHRHLAQIDAELARILMHRSLHRPRGAGAADLVLVEGHGLVDHDLTLEVPGLARRRFRQQEGEETRIGSRTLRHLQGGQIAMRRKRRSGACRAAAYEPGPPPELVESLRLIGRHPVAALVARQMRLAWACLIPGGVAARMLTLHPNTRSVWHLPERLFGSGSRGSQEWVPVTAPFTKVSSIERRQCAIVAPSQRQERPLSGISAQRPAAQGRGCKHCTVRLMAGRQGPGYVLPDAKPRLARDLLGRY